MSIKSLKRRGGFALSCTLSALAAVSLGFGSLPAYSQSSVPGKLGGELSVSPNGAATYRIPIEVPPGVAGMQPQLGLSYSSQGGNGIMGLGWSVEGLSAITRCPKTMPTDGVRGGVAHTNDDRFCFDGQRLINVAGAYGAAGSEYRTELESFSRVTAVGSAGSGPASFTVRTKSGLTMQFGATTDSSFKHSSTNSLVRVWALNRISDAKNNHIDFAYNTEQLIDTVSYAGRSVQFVYETRPDRARAYQAGSQASQVSRLTTVRTRIGTNMVSEWRVTYSLNSSAYGSMPESIKRCVVGNNCQEPTTFAYRSSTTGQQPTLSMNASAPSQKITHFSHNRLEPRVNLIGGDFNGDGWEDLVSFTVPPQGYSPPCDEGGCAPVSNEARYRLNRSDGAGGFVTQQEYFGFTTSQINFNYLKLTAGDVNADQISDLIAYEIDSNTGIRTMVATGNANGVFTHHSHQVHTTSAYGGWSVLGSDVNGDGRTDLVVYLLGSQGLRTRVLLSNGTGGFTLQSQTDHLATNMTGWQIAPADVNRDGLTDLLIYQSGSVDIRARPLLSQGNGQFTMQAEQVVHNGNYGGWSLSVGDVNGDGQPDLQALKLDTTSFNAQVFIGKGDGSYEARASQTHSLGSPPAGGTNWKLLTVDTNHDGLGDLIFYTSRNQEVVLRPYFFDDTGLFVARNVVTWSGIAGLYHPESASAELRASGHRSDGSNHLLMTTQFVEQVCADQECNPMSQYSTKLYPIQNLDSSRLLSNVSTSNASTQLTYASATTAIHTREAASGYPQLSLSYPLQVVSTVQRANGLGGFNSTNYSYGGLKAEIASPAHPGTGRGLLGFRWMKAMEAATGIESYTEHSQAWPTIGQTIKAETNRAASGNGGLLKRTTTTHGCYQTGSEHGTTAPSTATTACGTWAAGKVYFPFVSQSIEDSWDLNGAAMPRLTTYSTLGGYVDQGSAIRQFGDPTQLQVDIHQGGALKHRKLTANEYHPAQTGGTDWRLGRLKKATVTSTQY